MVFRDAIQKENLWWRFIDREEVKHYLEGRVFLQRKDYEILSVTMDGFRGLSNVFKAFPVQFCHFHQRQIIRRYVTQNPRLQAGIDLKELVEQLTSLSEKVFTQKLRDYIDVHKDFLNEKTTDPFTNKWSFTHRRLRSAIKSLETNLPQLFTFQNYPELTIPTTTNSLESFFSHMKDVVRIHRGLSRTMKEKVVETILMNSSIVKKRPKK